jgi:DNA-binding transcriptional LysR family regulator
MPLSYLSAYIADGRLVPILTDWTWVSDGFFLYYPSRRQIPAPLQSLMEFLSKNYLISRFQL